MGCWRNVVILFYYVCSLLIEQRCECALRLYIMVFDALKVFLFVRSVFLTDDKSRTVVKRFFPFFLS